MDYEKEYKKKLGDAKYWHDVSEGDIPAVLEGIFPELKESEDERARKRLIAMCQHYIECYSLDQFNLDDYKEALAWLEKQAKKSSKWSEEDEKMVNDIITAIDTLYQHGMVNWLKGIYCHEMVNWLKGIKSRI